MHYAGAYAIFQMVPWEMIRESKSQVRALVDWAFLGLFGAQDESIMGQIQGAVSRLKNGISKET